MALKQQLAQRLEQRLSPQQIQLMKLLQVPTMELDQRIKQEIEENPALEEGEDKEEDDFDNTDDEFDDDSDNDDDFDLSDYLDDDSSDYKTQANNSSKDDEERVIPLSGEQSFQEKLTEQLHLLDLDDKQFLIADILIGNLDESGYLNRDLEAIVDDLAFSMNVEANEEEVAVILSLIQELDPAGVGARNLQECLLLQIKRKQDGDIVRYTAKKILEDFFDEFTKKHYDKIAKKLEIEDEDLKASNLILYSYWHDYRALALALLHKKNDDFKVISRAHRWDIYFNENQKKYLPFKNFIINNLHATYTISQHGKDEFERVLEKKLDKKVIVSRLGKYNNRKPNLRQNNNKFINIVS
jgi:DNA-directed RNA polymerase specialized sigma54-like protein